MSFGRIVVRIILVLVLVGACLLGALVWSRRGPEHAWQQAQAAVAADNYETAKIYLHKLLEYDPEHGEGHLQLAKVYLLEARAEKQPATYATNAPAFNHLLEASRRLPADHQAQLDLLDVYLDTGRMAEAAVVATRIDAKNTTETQDADVLLALAWQAVDRKDVVQAKALFERLKAVPSLRPFQTLSLMAQHFQDNSDQAQLQGILSQAIETARTTDADLLASLSPREHQSLTNLVKLSIHLANNDEVLQARFPNAMEVLEKLQIQQPQDSRQLAQTAAELAFLVRTKINPSAQNQLPETWIELIQTAAPVWQSAIKSGEAEPLVYHEAAQAAFDLQRMDDGMKLLEQGIADTSARENLTPQQKGVLLQLHLNAARKLVMLGKFDQADRHLRILLDNPDSAGWGNLIAGSIAHSEGRMEAALAHYLQAQQKLGNTLLVRIALANAYSALKQWDQALPLLQDLRASFEKLDPEQQAWAEQHLGTMSHIQFAELRANLTLDKWEAAQANLAALKETQFEPQAWTLIIAYLLKDNEVEQALALLDEARRSFPRDIALTRLKLTFLLQEKKEKEAETMLKKLAAESPDDLNAQALLSQWYIEREQYDAALEHLASQEKKFQDNKQQRLTIVALQAQALLAKGDSQGVLDLVAPLLEDPDTQSQAAILSTAAYLKDNNLAAASQTLSDVAAGSPRRADVALMKGQLALAQGDYEDAVDMLLKPLNVTALRDRARMLMFNSVQKLAREKPANEVMAKIDELLRKQPNDTLLRLLKSELMLQVGQVDQAMTLLDETTGNPAEVTAVHQLKSRGFMLKKQFTLAMREIEKALKLDPKQITSLIMASQISLAQARYEDARKYAVSAIDQDPSSPTPHLLQAEALVKLDMLPEAVTVLEALTKNLPKFPAGHLALIGVLEKTEDSAKTLAAIRTARKELPDDNRFLAAEIGALCKDNQVAAAEAVGEEALGDDPQGATLMAVAQAFAIAKQADTAIAWAERTLPVGNRQEKAQAHLILGNLILQQHLAENDIKLLEKACDHFTEVLSVQPTNLVAGNNLAWHLATDFNRPDEAVRICQQVRGEATVQQMPVSFIDTMLTAYLKANRVEEAQQLLSEALVDHPNQPMLYQQLGLAMLATNRPNDALVAFRKALALGLAGQRAEDVQRHVTELTQVPE